MTANRARGRVKPNGMNQMERDYGAQLEILKRAGDIAWYRYEGLKLRLADKTFYTPDFAVMQSSGLLECHEVKGFWEDDARVKIKVAAEMYPFRFLAITRQTKAKGGGFVTETFE